MKFNTFIIVFFGFVFSTHFYAQNTFDIVFPGAERDQVCKACFEVFNQKPKETQFSIVREGANLFFEVNDKEWFKRLIKNDGDGIAIDVVNKNRYDCNESSLEQKQIKGILLKPIYGSKLFETMKPRGTTHFRVLVGRLNPDMMNKELEYNILFLSNKNLCRYQVIYNLASYPWDLLDMGMYLDSLTYNNQGIKSNGDKGMILKNKTIVFKIPFEKNKATYSQADIKPIYDSLRLTDFNIKSINIVAYASIEGSVDRNLELQVQRAKSIVEALQSFQKPTIKTEVTSSENWVEFLNDIKSTKYSDWGALSKDQIKSKLVGNVSKEFEPILQKHRKAVVRLELDKIDRYENMTADVLITKFNEALQADKLEEAHEIQNSIFKKMQSKTVHPNLLMKMQLPKQLKYVPFLNKNAAFRYSLDEKDMLIVYNELLELEKLAPKDEKVRYNLTALQIKLWRYKAIDTKEADVKTQIMDLKKYNIANPLIDRMLVNFHIVKAENQMRERDYKNKDVSVTFIENNYKKFPLSDSDYLSLAQFFTYYANLDKAVALLDKKSRQIDIDEDLLFYYLNLTMINNELTQKQEYRTILLNASSINKKRFCKLFNPIEKEGVTFQLLENDYLRSAYCENCK
jgi:hypothetical protein